MLSSSACGAGLAAGPCLIGLTGPAVARAVDKVASLFLAAIAVAMIRAGVVGFLAGAGSV